jgi:hypothetical protein
LTEKVTTENPYSLHMDKHGIIDVNLWFALVILCEIHADRK